MFFAEIKILQFFYSSDNSILKRILFDEILIEMSTQIWVFYYLILFYRNKFIKIF